MAIGSHEGVLKEDRLSLVPLSSKEMREFPALLVVEIESSDPEEVPSHMTWPKY